MLITMKKTVKGAEQGIHVREYLAGETYTVSDELGEVLVGAGFADSVAQPAEPVAPPAAPVAEADPLEGMTVPNLRIKAEVDGIDLGKLTLKADIVALMQAEYAARAAAAINEAEAAAAAAEAAAKAAAQANA